MKRVHYLLATMALTGMVVASCGLSHDRDVYYTEMASREPFFDEGSQNNDQFSEFDDNPFVSADEQPVSTFSIDADGAAYGITRCYLTSGYTVNRNSVRIEEYLNYFTFDYPSPKGDNAVSINAEWSECPWKPGNVLLRLGLKGKEVADADLPRANFVFLVDVSGSMDEEEKIGLLKSGLIELLSHLQPDDRISLITYSGDVKKLLESTPVRKKEVIERAIGKLSAYGSTAGGEALRMAYEEALANYNPAYNNRIIMGTDGDFNVGVTNTDSLVAMVERYASKGIYMTCLGFGMGNLNDAMMERISNAGNGTYNYIDCEDEMMKVFVHERQRFVSVANDTKCQVTFDPKLVSRYRLIGYENRVMNNEDFEDDSKDAGEIGAGQTITALYEIEPTPYFVDGWMPDSRTNRHVMATFDCRYKKKLDGKSVELSTDVAVEDGYSSDMQRLPASENMRFAAGVAAFGLVMRQSEFRGKATLDMAHGLVDGACDFDPHGYRRQLVGLIDKAKEVNEDN